MAEARRKRRLQVRLSADLMRSAEELAERSGISVSSFIRLLVEDSLAAGPKNVPEALLGRGDVESRVVSLASLVASENALLAVEKILPRDHWEAGGLRAEAIARAEQRLADVRSHVEREQL